MTKTLLITTLASFALASAVLAAPAAPVLGNGQAAPAPAGAAAAAPSVSENQGCCASGAYGVSFVEEGQSVKVRIKSSSEGWTWESAAIDGKVVPHKHGETSCRATVADMDADGQPEVVVTISDGAPGGSVYVWKRANRAFKAIPVEVGPGVGTRDFLVWDLSGTVDAPVKITAFGHIEVQGKLMALLGMSSGEGTFRWRVSRGMVRHLETIASKPAGQ